MTAVLVASASSAAAAVVVHGLWPPGTIAGAALMPVLVALFDELLRHPAERLTHAVRERLAPRDPLRSAPAPSYRIYRVRPTFWRVLATGMTAFAIGATTLTAAELALHRSLGDREDRTTLLGGQRTQPRPPSPSTGWPQAPDVGQPTTAAPMPAGEPKQREAARRRRSSRAPERRRDPHRRRPPDTPASPIPPGATPAPPPAEAPPSTVPTPAPPPPSNDSSGTSPPSQ
ncbi:MAG: hypothetical protein ACXVFM_02740 [Solirubrobacteraceae bacterium]